MQIKYGRESAKKERSANQFHSLNEYEIFDGNSSSLDMLIDKKMPRRTYSFLHKFPIRKYSGTHCDDIDECSEDIHQCDANARCENREHGYSCSCLNGYQGNGFHCRDINECVQDASLCQGVGDCLNTAGKGSRDCHSNGYITSGSFTCQCPRGYGFNGTDCEDINECANFHACHVDAECINSVGDYS